MHALMIDIETMSTRPNAAVTAIGACVFNLVVQDEILDTFSQNISLESNEDYGRDFQAGTLSWWLKQSQEAQMAMFENQTNLKQALKRFRMWVDDQKPKPTVVFAKDPDFDVVILKSAFDATDELWSYGFWMNRSVRTVSEWAFPHHEDMKNAEAYYRGESTHHKAVDDAVAQAKMVQACYQRMVVNNPSIA